MNWLHWYSIGLLSIALGGCSGGGDPSDDTSNDPPPPPPASGIGGLWSGAVLWEPRDGFPGGALNARALVAETGEFRIVLYEDFDQYFDPRNEQISGTFRTASGDITTRGDAVWAAPLNETADDWAVFGLAGEYAEGDFISGEFQANFAAWTHIEERVGTLTMHYHSIYERPSSLAILAGTYTTPDETLTIDDQGVVFYQSLATGCTGNGTARIIHPDFNMYRVTIDVDGCTGDAEIRNGLSFTGLANIGENNDLTGATLNATFEMAASAQRGLAFGTSHVPWFLRAHQS